MSHRKNIQMNKTLYYDNKLSYHLSPHQGEVPELEEDIPAGCIMAYVTFTAPRGWLICDGTAISRTDYWKLFEVIGTTFGSGDGTTTFNLPDYRGAFLRGTGTKGNYTGPDLNTSQNHATQTHNHLATSTVTDPGHNHIQTSANDDFNNSSGTYPSGANPSYPLYDSGSRNWINTINSSTTGITVATTVANSTTSVHPTETRPYNFGVNWIIKT